MTTRPDLIACETLLTRVANAAVVKYDCNLEQIATSVLIPRLQRAINQAYHHSSGRGEVGLDAVAEALRGERASGADLMASLGNTVIDDVVSQLDRLCKPTTRAVLRDVILRSS